MGNVKRDQDRNPHQDEEKVQDPGYRGAKEPGEGTTFSTIRLSRVVTIDNTNIEHDQLSNNRLAQFPISMSYARSGMLYSMMMMRIVYSSFLLRDCCASDCLGNSRRSQQLTYWHGSYFTHHMHQWRESTALQTFYSLSVRRDDARGTIDKPVASLDSLPHK